MHIAKCDSQCNFESERNFLGHTFSDADWHNTNVGHDVTVTENDGTVWHLTNGDDNPMREDGWRIKHPEIAAVL